MIVSIMQPAYLPWLGYFDRMARSDLLVLLDDVDIDLNSRTKFANRNRIRTPQGSTWLTVPLRMAGRDERRIDRIAIDGSLDWRSKHRRAVAHSYGRAPHYDAFARAVHAIIDTDGDRLAPIIEASVRSLARMLGIDTPIVRSADLGVAGRKDALILNICRAVGAQRYISGPFGREYLSRDAFRDGGIDLVFHDYDHPTYPQPFPGFQPFMSVIDLLFCCGPESRTILTQARTPEVSR